MPTHRRTTYHDDVLLRPDEVRSFDRGWAESVVVVRQGRAVHLRVRPTELTVPR